MRDADCERQVAQRELDTEAERVHERERARERMRMAEQQPQS